MMIKTIVDGTGIPVEIGVICDGHGVPVECVLRDGECTVAYYNDATVQTNGVTHPPLRGVWDFQAETWKETASTQEIAQAYAPIQMSQVDALDLIDAQVTYTAMMTDTLLPDGGAGAAESEGNTHAG